MHDVVKEHGIPGTSVVGKSSFDDVNTDRGARAFHRRDQTLADARIVANIGDEACNL